MLRSVFCLSIILMFPMKFSSEFPYIQEQGMTGFAIHQVVSAEIEDEPQIYKVRGMATFSSGIKQDNVSILVYTKSGRGGNVQLQMLGSESDREPNIADWQSNNEWEIEVWLGTKLKSDTSYLVYAVAIQDFNPADYGKLISLTHDKYKVFRSEVINVLTQGKFKLLGQTQKTVTVNRRKKT